LSKPGRDIRTSQWGEEASHGQCETGGGSGATVPDRTHAQAQRFWRSSEKIAAAGLNAVIELAGNGPLTILTYKNHPHGSKEAIKTLFLREMIAAGLLVNASHNICFAHTDADIERVLAGYDHALTALRGALDLGDIAHCSGNQVIKPIFSVRS
jgi:hypothetical protein